MKPSRTRHKRGAGFALAAMLSAALLLGFLNAWHPAFDSLSHFRAHLAVLVGLVALPALFSPRWKEAAAALALAMASLASISAPFALSGFTPVKAAFEPAGDGRVVYRLMQLNLQVDNPNPEKVLSLIRTSQPDVITLNEVSKKWIAALRDLSAAYPYSLICPPLAILSRQPFGRLAAQRCYEGATFATAAVNFNGQEVTVAAMHLGWPWPYGQSRNIDRVVPLLATLTGTVILAGDLNAAGWSAAASRLAKAGGLTLVPSVGPTWLHRSLPIALRPWIGLPIDHVFAKGNVVIRSAKAEGDAGSDHLPVFVEFSVPALPKK
jgi:endonuclease/exonuclease/phosphatase (EEP) superfamily protein YafD